MSLKKVATCVIALGAIATYNANAAISKETCEKSDKTIWVENVQNADGTRGACVPKNACKVDAFKDKFCNTAFLHDGGINPILGPYEKAIVNAYVQNVLGWANGCDKFVEIGDIDNSNYIGCYANGNYQTFAYWTGGGDENLLAATCIAVGGRPDIRDNGMYNYVVHCVDISAEMCQKLIGTEAVKTEYNETGCHNLDLYKTNNQVGKIW